MVLRILGGLRQDDDGVARETPVERRRGDGRRKETFNRLLFRLQLKCRLREEVTSLGAIRLNFPIIHGKLGVAKKSEGEAEGAEEPLPSAHRVVEAASVVVDVMG